MALGRFSPVIGCGCRVSALHQHAPTLPVWSAMQPPIGQETKTDLHRKIRSRSIGAGGKLPSSRLLSQFAQHFFFQASARGNKAE